MVGKSKTKRNPLLPEEFIERTVSTQNSLPLPLLHLAAYHGIVFAILPLIKAGGDVFHVIRTPGYEFSGKTPSEIASQRGHHRVQQLIEMYGNERIEALSTTTGEMLSTSPATISLPVSY